MIVVNIKGGLGNQMFQYALGRRLSIQNHDILKLDISGLDRANKVGDIYRPFALDKFNIQNNIASQEEIQKIKYPIGVFSKVVRKFRFKILRQMHIGYDPTFLNIHGDFYLDGYWQSPKYFEEIREIILSDFKLKNPMSKGASKMFEQIQSSQAVSLHVRRGDYITNPKTRTKYGTCSPEYYKRACEEIEKIESNVTYFVFSDDIDWVKSNINLPADTNYVKDPTISDAEEIVLMSSCMHNIIANSTFSWWGAWLNKYPNKIVVAPTPWFDTRSNKHKDLIPDSWKQIPKN